MSNTAIHWQEPPLDAIPESFVTAVQAYVPESSGQWAAQLLWQRGVRQTEALAPFLDPTQYMPASPLAFGEEMTQAVARLLKAWRQNEAIAIWGDFDADGLTATAVLWDGLGQFFPQDTRLTYVIPNRLTDSHGLHRAGLAALHQAGYRVVVTCDTGSTNLAELAYAQSLGLDVIVTDHHTLPSDRPPVTAIINPRALPSNHPLATLSGVAVAYKLVEALYAALPDVPNQPLERLLDLVAIGLVADLVELRGDCRYLAQQGITQLQKNLRHPPPRPGVAKLLELCRRNGDRPTDISFGIGPRINAISRIHGDAHFGVELLTSQDAARCAQLAEETELANTRRKALQRDVAQQVATRLASLDMSTTRVIVLADEQWEPGVLGLVAGQIAQEYGRPTILLAVDPAVDADTPATQPGELCHRLARGSARSTHGIDLYQLVAAHAHLLHRFGGHPFAAGLSLPVENLDLFTDAINRQLRQQPTAEQSASPATDLTVTIADLGKPLFDELKLLEPCGMGNPTPRLLLQNCWFERAWNANIKDLRNHKVRYIKTECVVRDDTGASFSGVWWGHYKDELPTGRCDAIAELDFNSYSNPARNQQPHYEIRLLAVRPAQSIQSSTTETNWLLDWRTSSPLSPAPATEPAADVLTLNHCPRSWDELRYWLHQAQAEAKSLAIAYPLPVLEPPIHIWQRFIGLAKYLSRTGQPVNRDRLCDLLHVGDRTLQLGLHSLEQLGFHCQIVGPQVTLTLPNPASEPSATASDAVQQFLQAIQEEQFQQRYFAHISIEALQALSV